MTDQPREQACPCWRCGIDPHTRRPRRMTWNPSGLCDQHEATDTDAQQAS